MFGTFQRSSSEFLGHPRTSSHVHMSSPLINFPFSCPLTDHQLTHMAAVAAAAAESLDSVSETLHSGSSMGCAGSYNSPPSSLASCCSTQKPSYLPRSISSHSLHKNGLHYCHLGSNFNDFLHDSDSCPVRRVFSTGDLDQGQLRRRRSESPLSNESNAIIEGMSRACRYSPEEKKERIERYRTKRNLRNFNKKIKYACRKTLADSRPRIRGRFARNDEVEKNPQIEWSHISGEEEEEEENWIDFLDSLSVNLINP